MSTEARPLLCRHTTQIFCMCEKSKANVVAETDEMRSKPRSPGQHKSHDNGTASTGPEEWSATLATRTGSPGYDGDSELSRGGTPTAQMSRGKRPSGVKLVKPSNDSGDDDPFEYKPRPPESVVTQDRLDPPAGSTYWSEAEEKGAKRKERIVKKFRKCGGLHKPNTTSDPEPPRDNEVEMEMHVFWVEDGTLQYWED